MYWQSVINTVGDFGKLEFGMYSHGKVGPIVNFLILLVTGYVLFSARVTNAFITRVFIDNRIQTTISSIKSAFVIIRYVIAKTISNTIPILTI